MFYGEGVCHAFCNRLFGGSVQRVTPCGKALHGITPCKTAACIKAVISTVAKTNTGNMVLLTAFMQLIA
jgi:hypothetical protein